MISANTTEVEAPADSTALADGGGDCVWAPHPRASVYTLFGQTVASELPLSGGMPAPHDSVPMIQIIEDLAGEEIGRAKAKPWDVEGGAYLASAGRILLALEGVGEFLVEEGRRIFVAPAATAGALALQDALLTSPLGALFLQRNLITLHASSVVLDRGAIALVGASGTGKSTIASWLYTAGAGVLSDDMAIISEHDATTAWIAGGIPELRLAKPAYALVRNLNADIPSRLSSGGKFVMKLEDQSESSKQKLASVYVLEVSNGAEIQFRTIHGQEKIRTLLNNTYRAHFVVSMGATNPYVAILESVMDAFTVQIVSCPRGHSYLRRVAAMIWENREN